MKSFKEISEAHYAAAADYRVSASGRKVHRMKKIADDPRDLDHDGDVDKDDKKLAKELAKESVVPDHMKGKQKPYVSSDGKGNYEVLGNTGQTKATFSRKEHGKDAQSKAQAHLKSKYDEYMKEEVVDESVNKSDVPAYLRKKNGDKLTLKDLDKERTQNRSHPETLKKINGTQTEGCAPIAPVPDRKYIKGTPEWKANKEKNKPRTGHPTNEEVELDEAGHGGPLGYLSPEARAMEIARRKKALKANETPASKRFIDNAIKNIKPKNEEVELDEVLDMRHHATGTGSIHVSHTHTSPSRVHSIGYTDAHKISNLKAGEKHEYKNANGHETFTAHKQADGSTKIHDNRGTHVATIKNKMGRYDGQVKESLDEAVDKQEQRLLILARLGLVDKSEVSKLRIAIDQFKSDKTLSIAQRGLLFGVLTDLISLVTGDDMVFNRVKLDIQKEDYEIIEEEEIIVETKDDDKDDKPPFDGPYTKKPSAVAGKNGSGYSTARHLARLALQKQQQKKQGK